jgi:hypothetical protein
VLSSKCYRYYGQLRIPYRPNGISFPYIHQLPPCTTSVRASRATSNGFLCVSPLLPREPTRRLWQFLLGQVFQPSPCVHRVGNSILGYEATYRFAFAATRRFARLTMMSLCQGTQRFRSPLTSPSSYVGELPNSHDRTLTNKSFAIHGIRTHPIFLTLCPISFIISSCRE